MSKNANIKHIKSTTRRFIKLVESGRYKEEDLENMLGALVSSRDRVIKHLKKRAKPREFVLNERSIAGAVRDTINAHGDITKQQIGSAAKRIMAQCTRVIEADVVEPSKFVHVIGEQVKSKRDLTWLQIIVASLYHLVLKLVKLNNKLYD